MFLSCIQIDSFVSDQVFTLRICYPQLCLHQMIVMQLWAPELRLSQSLNGHQRVELARFVSLSWARADHSGHFFLLVLSSCLPTFPLKGYTNLCLAVPTLLKKKKPFSSLIWDACRFLKVESFPHANGLCSEKSLDLFLFDMTKDPWPKTMPWLKSCTSKKLY